MARVRVLLVEGAEAVRWARGALEDAVHGARDSVARVPPKALEAPCGAFVTLRTLDGALRGCTGFLEPDAPLHDVLARAGALSARDPRFEPVGAEELGRILVEVSVLTTPEPLRARSAEDLAAAVRIGEHGLVVQNGRLRGTLLPQVAVEQGFTAELFLAACCAKAGLDTEAWRADPSLRWWSFRAQVFGETEPGGAVLEAGTGERPEVA